MLKVRRTTVCIDTVIKAYKPYVVAASFTVAKLHSPFQTFEGATPLHSNGVKVLQGQERLPSFCS